MRRGVPGERDASHCAAGGAVDSQGVAVAGKRPGGDLHGGEVELGVVRVGEAERRRKQYRGGILLVGGIRNDERGRVIGRHDRDKRERGLAVVYSVIDDDLNDAVSRNRIVASRAEADRLQRSLVVGERSDVGERQGSGGRVVSGSGDAARQRQGGGQQIADLRVRQRDGRRSDRAADIGIADEGIGVRDCDRRPVLGERRVVVCSRERRVVAVEIEGGCTAVDLGDLDDRVRNIACRRPVVDDHVDDAGLGRRGGSVERDLPQCRLIVGSRCGAREREDPGDGIVDARRDAARKRRCGNDQAVASVRVRECDGRGGKAWTVVVHDRDVGVDDGDG